MKGSKGFKRCTVCLLDLVGITTFYNHLKSILPVGFILRGRFQYPTGVRRVTDPGSNGLAQLYTPAAQWSRNAWDSGDEPRGELALNFCTARKLPVLCLCFFACTELQVTHPETLPTSPTSQYLCHSRPPFLPTNKFKGG